MTVAVRTITVNYKITAAVTMIAATSIPIYVEGMISPAQIRAARAMLNWKQTDLAAASNVSEMSIKNIERGVTDPRASTLQAIQAAFEAAGIIFLEPGQDRPGGHGLRLA